MRDRTQAGPKVPNVTMSRHCSKTITLQDLGQAWRRFSQYLLDLCKVDSSPSALADCVLRAVASASIKLPAGPSVAIIATRKLLKA